MASFRFKLAAYFVVLSLLPLAAAWWAFGAIAERSVRTSADARLESGLRAALAAYADELREAELAARAVAREEGFQQAVRDGDRAGIAAALPSSPAMEVELPSGATVGSLPPSSGTRRVTIVAPDGETSVVAGVPIDRALLARLRTRSGITGDDRLLLVKSTEAAPGTLGARSIGGRDYRALAVGLEGRTGQVLVAATPSSELAAERRSFQARLLAGLIAAVLLIGGVAYLAGRSIVGSLGRLSNAANAIAAGRFKERVDVHGNDEFAQLGIAFNDMAEQLEQRLVDLEEERRRLRDATGRFGDALANTLDPGQLMRVIVETAVEATHAGGGFVIGTGGAMVHVGDPLAGPDRMEVPLTAARETFGTLVLLGEHFSEEDRISAVSLAGHASVALDNARLHRMVERQALVDGLTGLANRRHLDQELASNLARAERAGGSVSLILADLDDFKQVNDEHGHACGDTVLREFAALMNEVVREGDTAGRWGGEEFALLLPDTALDGAQRVAERLRQALEEQVILSPEGEPLRVTVSLGVAAYPDLGGRAELVAAADEALYRAKRAGKNQVVVTARDGHAA
jgi:diguanylate cyclase (GGDEF)-like protein